MGYKVIRNNDSSLDEKLKALEYMDIFQILNENRRITKVIFTSSSGKVSASRWFEQYLESRNILPAKILNLEKKYVFHSNK